MRPERVFGSGGSMLLRDFDRIRRGKRGVLDDCGIETGRGGAGVLGQMRKRRYVRDAQIIFGNSH